MNDYCKTILKRVMIFSWFISPFVLMYLNFLQVLPLTPLGSIGMDSDRSSGDVLSDALASGSWIFVLWGGPLLLTRIFRSPDVK